MIIQRFKECYNNDFIICIETITKRVMISDTEGGKYKSYPYVTLWSVSKMS